MYCMNCKVEVEPKKLGVRRKLKCPFCRKDKWGEKFYQCPKCTTTVIDTTHDKEGGHAFCKGCGFHPVQFVYVFKKKDR